QTDSDGKGVINILAADKLMTSPRTYSSFLLWILSELFENLPEVGDMDKPKLVFFFDEAHLLFSDSPKVLLEKIEQVVRLIRSKGVGVYFITQNPMDIPENILGQLGNRVQHALRAYTPKDQKAVKAAAETFRTNPKINVETAITELGVGEALVSFLEEKGAPSIVERAFILPPRSRIGSISVDERNEIIKKSVVYGAYEKTVDRESAYEILNKKSVADAENEENKEKEKKSVEKTKSAPKKEANYLDKALKIANSPIGKTIVRGVLGSIFGSSKKRR
ncbi:MAG TPA: DUF853 family protein, partial [Spirochaetota bacterium]|nr:DUF853 family protein [Spirochaetota bacterium]